ncbi:MAG: TolC family outer membrane protein [Campylobacterota bacterium]|nr:TolC family outer membrane protein [Campylobacterota bacterium]
MKKLFSAIVATSLIVTSIDALTLENAVEEVLNTNPLITERLKNYRKTVEDLNIAEAAYLPSVDLLSKVGYEDVRSTGDIEKDSAYYTYVHSLTVTQNIYNGFATKDRVNYQKARILAASHNYVEQANDVAFNLVKQYITVLKNKALLNAEEENVRITQDIYSKIQDVYDSGFGTLSDVKKVASSLQLAQFNMLTQKNNLMDSEFNLGRILGRNISYKDLELPVFSAGLPKDLDEASQYAVQNNPSLKVTEFNLQAAKMLFKESQTGYLPTLDLVLDHTFDNDINGNKGSGRQSSAMFVLSYNLYGGGADKANIQKNKSLIHQEFEIQKDIKRQVIEGLQLSWSAYTMIEKQLVFLNSYAQDSKNTLDLYREEFNTGQKTLLDLLTAQDDYITAEIKTITANHDWLFSKYRILDALGEMVNKVFAASNSYYSPVNLGDKKSDAYVIDEELNRDLDTDKIDDRYDLCDSSLSPAEVTKFGCIQRVEEKSDLKLVESSQVFDSFKKEFLNSKTAKYTISLSTYSSIEDAKAFLERNNFDQNSFMYRFPNTDKIKVLYGAFDTKEEASAVLKSFSLKVLLHKPYIMDIEKHREFYKTSLK